MNRAQAEEEAKRIASEMSSPNNMIGDSISVYDFCHGSAMAMYEAMRSKNRQTEKDSEIRRINREIAELKIESERHRIAMCAELQERIREITDGYLTKIMELDGQIRSLVESLKPYNGRLFSELSDSEEATKDDIICRIGYLKNDKSRVKECYLSDIGCAKRMRSIEIAKKSLDVKRRIHELEQRKDDILDTNWEGEA